MRNILALALLAIAVPAAAQAPERYDIYEQVRDEAGHVTGERLVEVFTVTPAPAPTLGGHLLALDHETGAAHIAVPHGSPAPEVPEP